MRAKIDINEVETRTKIRAKYLRAMENEEWDLLPGEVYVKSFLRTYGEYLGLDTRQLIDDFRRRYERLDDHELRPIAPLGRDRDRPPRRRGIPPWLVIAAVLVIIVVVLFFVGRNNPGSRSPSTTQAGTTTTHRARHRPREAPRPQGHAHDGQAPAAADRAGLRVPGRRHRQEADPRADLQHRADDPHEVGGQAAAHAGQQQRQDEGQRRHGPGDASAGSIGYRLVPGGHTPLSAAQQPKCA